MSVGEISSLDKTTWGAEAEFGNLLPLLARMLFTLELHGNKIECTGKTKFRKHLCVHSIIIMLTGYKLG